MKKANIEMYFSISHNTRNPQCVIELNVMMAINLALESVQKRNTEKSMKNKLINDYYRYKGFIIYLETEE